MRQVDVEDLSVIAGSEGVAAVGRHRERADVALLFFYYRIGTKQIARRAQGGEDIGILGIAAILVIQTVHLQRKETGDLWVFRLEDRQRQGARHGEVAQPRLLSLRRL